VTIESRLVILIIGRIYLSTSYTNNIAYHCTRWCRLCQRWISLQAL